ncbi:hypothetical protein JCM10450v2_002844 [Rhodotorula kratochvilovae]
MPVAGGASSSPSTRSAQTDHTSNGLEQGLKRLELADGAELLPQPLLAYFRDQPLAVAAFAHAPLADDEDLPQPAYQNPALLHFLGQGVGGAAPGSRAHAEREARRAGLTLTDAVDDRSRELLRRFLKDGIERAAEPSTTTAGVFPSPGEHTDPLKVIHPSPASGARPRPGSSSASTSFSSRHSRFQPHRQIALQLVSGVNFSKVHWRASVFLEFGCTVLTMLPASNVANGGLFTEAEEDEEEDEDEIVHFGEEARATGENAAPEDEAEEPMVEGPSPPSSEARTEPERFPLSVQLARQRLGKRTHCEHVGEHEISLDGARDALSLEGLAFSAFNSPIGLFRVNRDLSITQANPKWRQTCGLAEGETNDAWPARIHPNDRDRVVAHYQRITAELPVERDELEFRWLPDGIRNRWCVCVIEPAIVNGVMDGYCGYLLNINKHKAALSGSELREEQLRHELALLSETASVGLVRIDLDGHFRSANDAFYAITRLDKSQQLDDWKDAVHPDDYEWVSEQWKHSLATLEPFQAQFRWRFGDVCLVQTVPNSRDRNVATGWIGSVTNVTAQARAEEDLLQLSKEREERAEQYAREAEERRKIAVEEKKQQELLIDVTSHEIRNPISAILQNADFTRSSLVALRRKFGELKERNLLPADLDGKLLADLDEDIEALDAITECGMAQERIANDILGLAQIQLSKYSITPVEFDLATSLRNICRMFKTECRTKSIELQLVIGSSLARLGPRARVFADPARLTQVLVNLLSNAIRFTAKSAKRVVTLTVEVSAQPPERDAPLIPPHETEYQIDKQKPVYLFFAVEDTGPGMTDEETSRLFAKFMQASPFTHTTWGGSGLGLWIARNLCELQAGHIEVASTVGKGSIFRCFITARSVDAGPSHSRAVAVIDGITAPNAERGRAPTVFLSKADEKMPLRGFTLLCCEDNQINRTVLRRQLVKEGCDDVLLACDGKEGLDLLNSRAAGSVDCILMDIEMPIMDGLSATRAIRQAERDGERPGRQRIVGVTGNARAAQKEAALEAGMDAVVTKPYKVPDLVARIRRDVPDDDATDASHASSAGAAAHGTYVPSGAAGEVTTTLASGATVEIIAPGSPTGSASSLTVAGKDEQQRSPPRLAQVEAQAVEEDGGGTVMLGKERVERAAGSMHHHGEGRTLPPSHPEGKSLEK